MLIRVPSLNDDILNVLLITKESEFTVTDAKKRKRIPKKKNKNTFTFQKLKPEILNLLKKTNLKQIVKQQKCQRLISLVNGSQVN